jgi:hypothetical protein
LVLGPLYQPFGSINQDLVGLTEQLFQAGQLLGFACGQALDFEQGLLSMGSSSNTYRSAVEASMPKLKPDTSKLG